MENTIKPGLYQHYHGNMYEVLHSNVKHSETRRPLVVYRVHCGNGSLYAKPLSLFAGTVIVDGNTVPRYKFVEWA